VIAAAAIETANDSGRDTAPAPSFRHVHGLGVNPNDGALYIATHSGMWRLAAGTKKPEPVGRSRQDTMGFTVAGLDRFLGSGHPDNFDQPPLLGLIESRDAGVSWRPISLQGRADFHVLRAMGRRVYGYDVAHARLLISSDRGRTWTERKLDTPLIDLVADPKAPERLVASTDAGLLTSIDAGASWKRIGPAIGLLGWPASRRLYLVAGDGTLKLSTTRGRVWKRLGTIGGQPAAFLARTTRELYVAVHDGPILRSRDGGRSWRVAAAT
jgi:hypothetical protein